MKKLFRFSISLSLATLSIFATHAATQDDTSLEVPLYKTQYSEHNKQLDPDGRRSPSIPVMCLITPDGIFTDMFSPETTDLYEIYGIDGEFCHLSTASEQVFVEYLFSNPQECQIRILTGEYCWTGYVGQY